MFNGYNSLETTAARDEVLCFLASPVYAFKAVYSKPITKVLFARDFALFASSLLALSAALSSLPSPVPEPHRTRATSVPGFVTHCPAGCLCHPFSWTQQQIFKMFLLRLSKRLFCRKSPRRNEQD